MKSNLCEGGPIFTVKFRPGPGFSGGSKYSVTPDSECIHICCIVEINARDCTV